VSFIDESTSHRSQAVAGNRLPFDRVSWEYHRTYDADIGEFISQDPLGYASGSTNLHEAFGDDPINNEDPTGLMFETGLEDSSAESIYSGSESAPAIGLAQDTSETEPAGPPTGFINDTSSVWNSGSNFNGDITSPGNLGFESYSINLSSDFDTALAESMAAPPERTTMTPAPLTSPGLLSYSDWYQAFGSRLPQVYPAGDIYLDQQYQAYVLSQGSPSIVLNQAQEQQQAEIAAGPQLEALPTSVPQSPSFSDVLNAAGFAIASVLGGEEHGEELEEEELAEEQALNSGFQNVVSEQFPNGENQAAVLKGYPGIGRTLDGVPDFAGSPYLYPVQAGQRNIVTIKLTGSYSDDEDLANSDAQLPNTPAGFVWHHLDYDPATGEGTLQLVEIDAHRATYSHAGGVSQYENSTGKSYKP
jgi:A nuclease of the HNH/ENDO VII superfamily with conserved WHH